MTRPVVLTDAESRAVIFALNERETTLEDRVDDGERGAARELAALQSARVKLYAATRP